MFQLIRLVSKKTIAANIFVQSLSKLTFLSIPVITMYLINSLVSKNKEQLLVYIGLSILMFLVSQMANYFVDVADGSATKEAWVSIYNRLDMEMKNCDLKKVPITQSELQQFMGQNYELIKNYILTIPIQLIINALYMLGIIICMFFISPVITITIIVAIPVFLYISNRFKSQIMMNSSQNLKDMETMKDFETDQFSLSKEERYLAEKQMNAISTYAKAYSSTMVKKIRVEAIFDNILSYGLLNLIILISIIMSAFFVFEGKMTIGALYAVQLYTSRFWDPAEFFATIRKGYLSTKPAIENFSHFLTLPLANYSNESITSLALENYASLDKDGLRLHKPINYQFIWGQLTLIRGANGIGKTTLIESILGFCDRFEGKILINDHPIGTHYPMDMVYIAANPYISKYGNSHFVNGSYGQKKMDQIKRALQTPKSVYIFDEPTNFLDVDNKQRIKDLIDSKVTAATAVIVISHDPIFNFSDAHRTSVLTITKT
ncbi:MAG: ABC transporter ATP-binding protein [Sporolactobacillus sp.]